MFEVRPDRLRGNSSDARMISLPTTGKELCHTLRGLRMKPHSQCFGDLGYGGEAWVALGTECAVPAFSAQASVFGYLRQALSHTGYPANFSRTARNASMYCACPVSRNAILRASLM